MILQVYMIFVLVSHDPTSVICSTLILGVFPLNQITNLGVNVRGTLSYTAVKLFSKYANLAVWSLITVPERYRQTDRRSDRRHTSIAYRARGKNHTANKHIAGIDILGMLHGYYRQESRAIAKMTARCALYIDAVKIFRSPWLRSSLRPRLLFPKLLMGFCCDRSYY